MFSSIYNTQTIEKIEKTGKHIQKSPKIRDILVSRLIIYIEKRREKEFLLKFLEILKKDKERSKGTMMRCKFCGGETVVIGVKGNCYDVKRRRECLGCGRRFLTTEIYERDIRSPKTFRAILADSKYLGSDSQSKSGRGMNDE